MQWCQSAFSSDEDSSSSSSSRSSPKRSFRGITYFFRRSKSTRRLTRQRKLRHLTNIDVGREPLNTFLRFGDDSDSEFCSTRSSPQPLPLPEFNSFLKDSPSASTSTSASRPSNFPLPSPKTCVQVDDRESTPDSDSNDDLGRNCIYQTIQKNTEDADTLSAKCPIDRSKKALQDRNGFSNVPTNTESNAASAVSAPDSGVSSPSLSPRGMVVGEGFPPYVASKDFYWSSPDMPSEDMLNDPFCLPLIDKNMSSHNINWSCPERSPHHGRGLYPKSPSAAASPLYLENNSQANVHPLPLPPPPLSSQSMSSHQTITKPDTSTMTCHWQKGKLIGRGTFGSVYVATNRETGALCAMKVVDLIPDDPKSAECIQQLEQEIKLLSQLKHPNIVQYYGSDIVDDHFNIYLEYVHPGSINKYVREHCGAITESVVRSFTRHILHGLAYLHSKKTVHRDIKGANLLVDASGVVKLADFGMAKRLNQAADLSMKGSPNWMAPEIIHAVSQKDTNGDLAFAVDIWSLGCTIIEIVNGKPPWSEFEGAAAMFKVWKETPPIPEILSPLGKDFLQCCFRRNPAERPTASMLLEHPFLKNSYPTEMQACTQSFSTMKLGDVSYSPRECTTYKFDSTSVSPRTHTTMTGKRSIKCETCQQSYPKTSYTAADCLHSPRSTLEILPSLSPPHSVHISKPSLDGFDVAGVVKKGSNRYSPETDTVSTHTIDHEMG